MNAKLIKKKIAGKESPILHWPNRNQTLQKEDKKPARFLNKNPELCYGDPSTENMLIQSDNIDALKALIPSHAGKIKCIFIDPPYNTKNTFEHYSDNLEHVNWLEMIYPRLEFMRELLSEDGSIWVIIDDNESHYLKIIMDEIFGRSNFISNCVWRRKYAPSNDARHISTLHDTLLCYSKNKKLWKVNLLPRSQKSNDRYKNYDNDNRGSWNAESLSVKSYSKKNDYIITSPEGIDFRPPPSRCWSVSKVKYEKLLKDNLIWFGKRGTSRPYKKKFLSEVQQGMVPTTLWIHEDTGDNAQAKNEITMLSEDKNNLFSTPKPEKLIQRIAALSTDENDIILDAFLGSGTTAAVAHKMRRKYIGIETGERAVKICYERLKKVVNGEQGGISKDVNWQGGGGFHFYTLGDSFIAPVKT